MRFGGDPGAIRGRSGGDPEAGDGATELDPVVAALPSLTLFTPDGAG
jgi:hypothetical protein